MLGHWRPSRTRAAAQADLHSPALGLWGAYRSAPSLSLEHGVSQLQFLPGRQAPGPAALCSSVVCLCGTASPGLCLSASPLAHQCSLEGPWLFGQGPSMVRDSAGKGVAEGPAQPSLTIKPGTWGRHRLLPASFPLHSFPTKVFSSRPHTASGCHVCWVPPVRDGPSVLDVPKGCRAAAPWRVRSRAPCGVPAWLR